VTLRIGLYHGYELTGSGSNEYSRYLSRALARLGHEVHVLCREPRPESIDHITQAIEWHRDGTARELFRREGAHTCVLHQLPDGPVRPVYLTDKQREGVVKAFTSMSDEELLEYHALNVDALKAVLDHNPVDILHANHLVYQPIAAADVDVPMIVFPHGSSIEYTLRQDGRLRGLARRAMLGSAGIISGSNEVLDRICALYPDDADALRAKSSIVGVGVDTSLFKPVMRAGRGEAIAQLPGGHGGKHPGQQDELRALLDVGDFGAVKQYRSAYDHAQPDADLAEHTARIPWEAGRILLFVGALTAGKGLQSLIAALPAVIARHTSVHLVVIGSGAYREVLEALVHAIATGNAELAAFLCSHGFDLDRSEIPGPWTDVRPPLAHEPRLAERVHFLGRLPHDLLSHVFPCADLAVFPSVVPEAYPLVLMEAMSNGVLPVVSDFSGFADGLRMLESLLGHELVDLMRLPVEPEGRVEGIAKKLNALLDDLADVDRGPGLRAVAVEHFDWDVRAVEMVAAYERALATC